MYEDSAASREIIFPQLEFSKLPETNPDAEILSGFRSAQLGLGYFEK